MSSLFSIEIEYKGGLSEDQKKVFAESAKRWEEIIQGPQLTLQLKAVGTKIDGAGGTLGRAGPTRIRLTDGLPLEGIMEFDLADLQSLENKGTLDSVILHEMGECVFASYCILSSSQGTAKSSQGYNSSEKIAY